MGVWIFRMWWSVQSLSFSKRLLHTEVLSSSFLMDQGWWCERLKLCIRFVCCIFLQYLPVSGAGFFCCSLQEHKQALGACGAGFFCWSLYKSKQALGGCGAGFFCCRKTSKQDLGALSFESIAAKKHLVMFSERAPGMESLILGFVSKDKLLYLVGAEKKQYCGRIIGHHPLSKITFMVSFSCRKLFL